MGSERVFSNRDIREMAEAGLNPEAAHAQLAIFRADHFHVRLARPCRVGDGVRRIPPGDMARLAAIHAGAATAGRFVKFVPASGAATRMFRGLCSLFHDAAANGCSPDAHPAASECLAFIRGLPRLAFHEDLRAVMARDGLDLDALIARESLPEILAYMLTDRGLDCARMPKGLLKFHRYPGGSRTAFEEHLVEAAACARDTRGAARLHFTVAPEAESRFREVLERARPALESALSVRFEVTFSGQRTSTHTVAVDAENRPFRDRDGALVLCPGGHGALLENLGDLGADLVFIKNIDNVVPDHLKGPTVAWKKVLGGYLADLEREVHERVRRLVAHPAPDAVAEAAAFARDVLGPAFAGEPDPAVLLDALNRPIRVCGMVENRGDPGGGPFWVEGPNGGLSPQIVEAAQVAMHDAAQRKVWASATHFNPVDLACGLRDAFGNPHDLSRFVDREAVLISHKTREGREMKVLELPGLWNGSMARWITIFVEVPRETFNPVKTVNDLLKPEHQPAG